MDHKKEINPDVKQIMIEVRKLLVFADCISRAKAEAKESGTFFGVDYFHEFIRVRADFWRNLKNNKYKALLRQFVKMSYYSYTPETEPDGITLEYVFNYQYDEIIKQLLEIEKEWK